MTKDTQHVRERLMGLGLGPDELKSLRNQGFLASEFRVRAGRRWGPYYKLRWRQNGRQRVLYLGIDENAVSEIRKVLETWQQPVRLEKEVNSLFRRTRRALKSLKDVLTPQICDDGKNWHGYESRRTRKLTLESETAKRNEITSFVEDPSLSGE